MCRAAARVRSGLEFRRECRRGGGVSQACRPIKLVRQRLREYVYDDDSSDDEGKAKERRGVERLLEPKQSDQRDQHNANARPDGVGDANRDGSQAEREEEEASRI